jgi:hypothetical protein
MTKVITDSRILLRVGLIVLRTMSGRSVEVCSSSILCLEPGELSWYSDGLPAERSRNWGSIKGKGKRCCSSPQSSH